MGWVGWADSSWSAASATKKLPLSVDPTPGSDWVLVTLIWALLLGSLT